MAKLGEITKEQKAAWRIASETETRGGSRAPVTGSAAVEHKKRQWWALADGDVRKVTGYWFPPNNPDMWWCPEVGFFGAEGHHLFETRDEAFAQAIAELERDLMALEKRLECLRRRRQNAEVTGA